MEKYFEVKTGKNKGFYIVTKIPQLLSTNIYMALGEKWGMLQYEYNSGFYNYHHINPFTEVVWTHSHFAGHEFNRKVFESLKKEIREIEALIAVMPL